MNAATQFAVSIEDAKLEKDDSKDLKDVLFKVFEILVEVAFPEAEVDKLVAHYGLKALKEIIKAVGDLGKEAMAEPPAKATYHEYIFSIREVGLASSPRSHRKPIANGLAGRLRFGCSIVWR